MLQVIYKRTLLLVLVLAVSFVNVNGQKRKSYEFYKDFQYTLINYLQT